MLIAAGVIATLMLAPGPASASDDGFSAISCASASLCVASLGSGVVTSTDPGQSKPTWRAAPIPGIDEADGYATPVSCSPAGFCAVNGGDVVTSARPAGGTAGWTLTAHGGQDPPARGEPRPFAPGGVACAGESTCVAGGAAASHPGANPFVWNRFGASLPRPAELDGLSCPSTALCVLSADKGSLGTTVYYSARPTGGAAAWHSSYTIPFALESLTCPSASLCVAPAYTYQGPLQELGQPGIAYSTAPTAGPSTWHFTPTPPLPNVQDLMGTHISCASPTLCVAAVTGGVSGTNQVLWSTNPTGGTSAWTLAALPGPFSGLSGISCAAPSLCAMVAAAPSPLVRVSTDPAGGPATWITTRVAVPEPALTAQRMSVSQASITGVASGHPKLTFTANRGRNSPGMFGFSIRLPNGLAFPGHRDAGLRRHSAVSSPGMRRVPFAFSAGGTRAGEELLIHSQTSLWTAHVTLTGPGFTAGRRLSLQVRSGRVRYVSVEISADDADPLINARRVRMRIS